MMVTILNLTKTLEGASEKLNETIWMKKIEWDGKKNKYKTEVQSYQAYNIKNEEY